MPTICIDTEEHPDAQSDECVEGQFDEFASCFPEASGQVTLPAWKYPQSRTELRTGRASSLAVFLSWS